MSFHEAIDAEYVTNIKKLPESRAIDPDNSEIMIKLKLKLITEVKLSQILHGFKCVDCHKHCNKHMVLF